MIEDRWAKMPCTWQTVPESHKAIAGVPAGIAIAALKLYITLCMRANFAPTETLVQSGCVKRSIMELGKLAGLSKPMTIAGLHQLQAWERIEVRGGRPTLYHITEYETAKYWAKLPSGHLYGGNSKKIMHLHRMSNRSKTTLHALQMYLYLASIRDKVSLKAKVTYEHLRDILGFGRNAISQAISALVSCDLVSVRLGELDEFNLTAHPSNIYWLRGSITEAHRRDAAAKRAAAEFSATFSTPSHS